jgi:hypothetical protein
MKTVILEFGKHRINPAKIVRYRGDGKPDEHGRHPRTKVRLDGGGVAIHIDMSPEQFSEALATYGGDDAVSVVKVKMPEQDKTDTPQ